MSGVVVTGVELFTFYMPIYGRSIGASASAIGIVLASYAGAAFLVRAMMPRLSRRLGEQKLLAAALIVGALAYLLFPMFHGIDRAGRSIACHDSTASAGNIRKVRLAAKSKTPRDPCSDPVTR